MHMGRCCLFWPRGCLRPTCSCCVGACACVNRSMKHCSCSACSISSRYLFCAGMRSDSLESDHPHCPACCADPVQLIEAALPKLPRIPGVTAHWLAINGVQPDLPGNSSAGPLPKKRRQPLGLPGQGSRLGSLQEAAAAAAAVAVAGALPGADLVMRRNCVHMRMLSAVPCASAEARSTRLF